MKYKFALVAALSATFAALSLPAAHAADAKAPEKKEQPAEKKEAAKPYPLDTCIVSDEKLGEMDEPYVFNYKGQEIKLCCKKCKAKFEKDPAKYLKKLEEKKAG